MNYISGFHRPFSLADVSIAYPNKPDIVSIPVVIVVALIAPAVIIAMLNLAGVSLFHDRLQKDTWRRVLWEIHVGWLGLCAGLAATLFVTSGLKDMVGKPRPNLLARCNPNLANISGFIVGGFGDSLNSEAEALVTSAICVQADHRLLDDAFAAFPSGHSSFSSAGLVYLSLWLCARFSLSIPFLDLDLGRRSQGSGNRKAVTFARDRQAAPPLWQLAVAFTPLVTALFICSSRYADFHHAGVDIIAGAIIGTLFAWASFRFYHLPMRRGYGSLAWGPRTRRHAFMSAPNDQDVLPDEEQNRDLNYELAAWASRPPERAHTGGSGEPIFPHNINQVSGRI